MEISLDDVYIQDIFTDEVGRASDDIHSLGVVHAYERSQSRHDARIAAAPDVGTLACRAGCSWCCYFSVDVRAVEVFRILEFVERELPDEERARIFAEARTNSAALRDLDEMDRMQRNVKCPFLGEGRCTIYAARPQMCRNYHATNVLGCQRSYEQPDNLDIDPDFAPYVYQAGGAHVDAFAKAMQAAGYDTNVYELSAALEAARADPDARKRFESKQRPFKKLLGREVPLEFDDSEER